MTGVSLNCLARPVRRTCWWHPALLAMVLLPGCGRVDRNLVEVKGRVTYHGAPVVDAVLGFTPIAASRGVAQRPATAFTDDQGIYRLQSYRDQFGMPPGDYHVTVLSYEGSMAEPETVRYLVPEKYSDPLTSGLVATIPEQRGETLQLDFDLP